MENNDAMYDFEGKARELNNWVQNAVMDAAMGEIYMERPDLDFTNRHELAESKADNMYCNHVILRDLYGDRIHDEVTLMGFHHGTKDFDWAWNKIWEELSHIDDTHKKAAELARR